MIIKDRAYADAPVAIAGPAAATAVADAAAEKDDGQTISKIGGIECVLEVRSDPVSHERRFNR